MNHDSSDFMTISSKLASVSSTTFPAYFLPPELPPDFYDDPPEDFPDNLTSAVVLTYYKAKSIIA